jgi:hypothetical protein
VLVKASSKLLLCSDLLAYSERQIPPLAEEEALFKNKSLRMNKNMVMGPDGTQN